MAASQHTKISRRIYLLILLLTIPTFCFADAGVPVLFITWPLMWFLLIPVILIESLVFMKALRNKWSQNIVPVGLANLVSTLVGFPLAWLAYLLVELPFGLFLPSIMDGRKPLWLKLLLVPFQGAWLYPDSNENLNWLLLVASLVGLIPAFYLSIYSESYVIDHFYKMNKDELKKIVWKANYWSYAFLLLLFPIGMYYFVFIKYK